MIREKTGDNMAPVAATRTMDKRRIAVVSPFLDPRYGTESRVLECLARLGEEYEFHVYSSRIEGLDPGRITWHRVPEMPGPHLVKYLWWLAANHVWRWWDRHVRGLRCEMTYTPGINCLDADLVTVHIVFAEYVARAADDLSFRRAPVRGWPRLLHRRLYYRLIVALERVIYSRKSQRLLVISRKTAQDLARHYGRSEPLPVVYHGLNLARFNPRQRVELRPMARRDLNLPDEHFAILLVGNDWVKKGLVYLIEALGRLADPNVCLLVAGRDDPAPYQLLLRRNGLEGRVVFLPIRHDVESYYAAADVYVGPSLEDAFALPPAEAMACGLPVIASRLAGVSEVITHGEDGLILEDPRDSATLARLISQLRDQPEFRCRLGQQAARTAQQYTWENNVARMREMFEEILRDKVQAAGHTVPREDPLR